MTSNEDFLLRPVMAGLCMYESLKDGKLDLIDVVKMNEALDVKASNEWRIRNLK